MSAEKRTEKKEKTGENILFWEKGLTLYVGYGMNDVDDVCQVGGQKNKTDRGAETISNPLEEMLDGRRGERGIRRSSGAGPMAPGRDAAEYAADCHFCGALSKKVEPCLGFTVPAKKSGACARVPRAFFIASASCFTFVNTPV